MSIFKGLHITLSHCIVFIIICSSYLSLTFLLSVIKTRDLYFVEIDNLRGLFQDVPPTKTGHVLHLFIWPKGTYIYIEAEMMMAVLLV